MCQITAFFDDLPFDQMRHQLGRDFTTIYVIDLGGNVRKNPRLSGTIHNVFGIWRGGSLCHRRQGSTRDAIVALPGAAQILLSLFKRLGVAPEHIKSIIAALRAHAEALRPIVLHDSIDTGSQTETRALWAQAQSEKAAF